MLSKKSSGHVGSGGVKFNPVQPQQPIIQPQPQQQEIQETVFRPPKQKKTKLKFQRE
jgi:hypothetical protein